MPAHPPDQRNPFREIIGLFEEAQQDARLRREQPPDEQMVKALSSAWQRRTRRMAELHRQARIVATEHGIPWDDLEPVLDRAGDRLMAIGGFRPEYIDGIWAKEEPTVKTPMELVHLLHDGEQIRGELGALADRLDGEIRRDARSGRYASSDQHEAAPT